MRKADFDAALWKYVGGPFHVYECLRCGYYVTANAPKQRRLHEQQCAGPRPHVDPSGSNYEAYGQG